ncbi:MAG: MerR family transcriptional regulator [Longimicrobiales bacterium]
MSSEVPTPIAKRTYYSIGEVGDLTGLKAHVLRYWESQFQVVSPTKNRAGNRVYKSKDIETLLLVKHLLYDRRYTIEGARKELKGLRGGKKLSEARSANAEPVLLREVTADLHRVLDILDVEKS